MPKAYEAITKLRICTDERGRWVMAVPGRHVPVIGRGYELASAEYLDIRTYRNWLRLLNKGWRVRGEA